jgi:alkylation response protein AidB-like acyl-CoA dehydrogenase
VTTSEEQIIRETVRAFRNKVVEREWERLDYPEPERYAALWRGLEEVGATGIARSGDGGQLSARARFNLFSELGAALPALGFGLISHHAALSLLACCQDADAAWPDGASDARFALAGSPLDGVPTGRFEVQTNGVMRLYGAARVAMPSPDWIVLHAVDGSRDRLAVLPAAAPRMVFVSQVSSHGLRLVPFGELRCDGVELDARHVFDWPEAGPVAREADGLVTSLLTGMLNEVAQRAMAYALVRYQGGKMIHEHDAVRELVGPMLVGARALEALAIAVLDGTGPGDGGASAFAVEAVRSAGLDAIQVFGGYGYMEDYRVERYLRDANTLETFWIHAAERRRTLAAQRFSELSATEVK